MDYRDPDWVGEKLGLDRNTVYRFLQEGRIPAVQLGRKWLISERQLEAWLAAETEKQTRERREGRRAAEASVRRVEHVTTEARAALKRAHAEARERRHEELDQVHLLAALTRDGKSPAGRALRSLGVTADVVREFLETKLPGGESEPARRLPRTPAAKRDMRLAARLAMRDAAGAPLAPVGTDHLLEGVFLARGGNGHELLAAHGVTRRSLRAALRSHKKENPS